MKEFNFVGMAACGGGLSETVLNTLERLPDMVGKHGGDLHNLLYNEYQHYTSYDAAEVDLDEVGTFNCVKCVVKYQNDNYGRVSNDIDACKVADLMVYIMGECLLRQSDHLQSSCWDRELTEDDVAIITDELQTYLEGLPDDLTNVAFDDVGV